jgi:hypothetical protein
MTVMTVMNQMSKTIMIPLLAEPCEMSNAMMGQYVKDESQMCQPSHQIGVIKCEPSHVIWVMPIVGPTISDG